MAREPLPSPPPASMHGHAMDRLAFIRLTMERAGGTLSVPPVPVMGGCFRAFGLAALLVPAAWGDWWLALGFGLLHAAFGIRIEVKRRG